MGIYEVMVRRGKSRVASRHRVWLSERLLRSTTSPISAASRPSGCARVMPPTPDLRPPFNGNHQFSFVGKVPRASSPNSRRRRARQVLRQCGFDTNTVTAGRRKLMGDRIHAAARGVTQCLHSVNKRDAASE
ncbi:hypothetical protein KCP77_07365 [Salmonella enterica subsp. enterica]|nr:hypothetical protein KCP77_07365 [Salmonella enterica subsp. enterica]